VDVFVYRAVRELGALVATLGGLDALVLTGGIGLHAAPIRARICEKLEWLGVRLDAAANESGAEKISANESKVALWALPTDEELVIASAALRSLLP
jgi:acetate kinase